MKKIAIVLGTRPEAIKLIPVYYALKQSRNCKPYLVSTGQHKEMLQQIFDFFEVVPDIELNVMQPGQRLAALTARLSEELDKLFERESFDMVMVQGDTSTAFVASLIAFYHKIEVSHIEAGLRTYDMHSPFPEEMNRTLIANIAKYHFAPSSIAVECLAKENRKNIFCVGNTVIDSLLLCKTKVDENEAYYRDLFSEWLPNGATKMVLITGHRRESFGEGFQNICNAIKALSARYPDYFFVYPVHLNPNVQEIVHETLTSLPNVKLIAPLPYDQLVFLMSRSYIILTDSGGIQEEAPSLDVPVIVMRDKTEREEGIKAGCAKLAGTSYNGIVETFRQVADNKEIYHQMASSENPYGDGTTSKQIVEIIESHSLIKHTHETLCNSTV